MLASAKLMEGQNASIWWLKYSSFVREAIKFTNYFLPQWLLIGCHLQDQLPILLCQTSQTYGKVDSCIINRNTQYETNDTEKAVDEYEE